MMDVRLGLLPRWLGAASGAAKASQAAVLAASLQRLQVEGMPVRVLTVVADDWTDVPRCAVDPVEFAAGLAAGMVDAVVQTELDVTELSVRGIARPVRTERL